MVSRTIIAFDFHIVKFFSSNCGIVWIEVIFEWFDKEEEEDIINRTRWIALIQVVGTHDLSGLTNEKNWENTERYHKGFSLSKGSHKENKNKSL